MSILFFPCSLLETIDFHFEFVCKEPNRLEELIFHIPMFINVNYLFLSLSNSREEEKKKKKPPRIFFIRGLNY